MNELTYMNYIEESERASFIKEKAFNDEFEKLNILFEMVTLQEKLHNIDVENRVLKESGSYDDYAVLLMEANEQVSQEKQGIIAKIFQWFADLFEKLHQAIVGIFAKKTNPQQDVQAPALFNDPQFQSTIDTAVNLIKSNVIPIIGSAAMTALAAVFRDKIETGLKKAADFISNKLNSGGFATMKASVLQTATTKLQGVMTFFKDLIGKLNNKKPENDQSAGNEHGILKSIADFMKKAVSEPLGAITKAFSGATQASQQQPQNNQAPQQPTQQAAPAQPAQNPNPAPAAQPQPQPAPVNASADTEELTDGDLSMYESIFGQVEEKKDEEDITDLLNMI